MLLVILGAGASWDSVPDAPEHQEPDFYRPPLAPGLFDARRRNFGEVLLRYGEATPLIIDLERRLKAPDGQSLEEELERFQEEGDSTYPPRIQQLTAVRFYLQRILWECSSEWQRERFGKNNYVDLFGRLDRWGHSANQQIAIATFNYDTLLDKAFSTVYRRPLDNVGNYMDQKAALYKLHGSVNWGRRVIGLPRFALKPDGSESSEEKADVIRHKLIHESATLTLSATYEVLDKYLTPAIRGEVLYPALAIPFARKSAFDCPAAHLDLLKQHLPSVNRILVVGWRGAEEHFLRLMDLVRGKAPRILVVGWESAGVSETSERLESAGFASSNIHTDPRGFSKFLEDDSLEKFLTAGIQDP